ncbi:SDR family oxidoreductase [Leifsonia kafniensis]|uniref:SDR family oxidoreductase n=1 Tax=Leifsonia kafniensis TaxID=475957 RepID=A0ABP7KRI2_9MICO
MNVTFDYRDTVALVTGSGSGIGRASALAFATAGADVAVADISETAGRASVELIRSAGGSAEFFPVDVADPDSAERLIAAIVARYGKLDIAHNNAGVEGVHEPLADIPVEDWRRVIDVDLSSVFYCMRAEIPVMVAQGGGVIVNTASASGLIGGYGLGAYTAAKHGVIGLTRAAALDYGERNIRINAVCPGPIDTPFISGLPTEQLDRLTLNSGMVRLGQAEEIAQAVLWLCSPGASFVTGHPMAVDGGVVVGGFGTRSDDLVAAAL